MLKVIIEDYDQLSDEEKEFVPKNGCGEKCASYLSCAKSLGL